MSLKIYQSLKSVYLSCYIRINGKLVNIKFTGGQKAPKLHNGCLTTDDPVLQSALESNPEYGRLWTCIIGEKPVAATLPQRPTGEQGEQPKPTMSISGITNGQQARDYILSNHGDLYNYQQIKSREQILEASKKLNIIFPDWDYPPK